jgi:hypothetical protein
MGKHVLTTFFFSALTPNVVGWFVRGVRELIVDSYGEVFASIPNLIVNASWQGD